MKASSNNQSLETQLQTHAKVYAIHMPESFGLGNRSYLNGNGGNAVTGRKQLHAIWAGGSGAPSHRWLGSLGNRTVKRPSNGR